MTWAMDHWVACVDDDMIWQGIQTMCDGNGLHTVVQRFCHFAFDYWLTGKSSWRNSVKEIPSIIHITSTICSDTVCLYWGIRNNATETQKLGELLKVKMHHALLVSNIINSNIFNSK